MSWRVILLWWLGAHFAFASFVPPDPANRLTFTISPLGHSNSVMFNHQGLPNLLTDPFGLGAANLATSLDHGTDLQGNNLDPSDAYQTTLESAVFAGSLLLSLPADEAAAETTAADPQMITVLGSGRDVAPYVGKPGFNTFTGAGIPAAELDTQNALWLNSAIQRGDQIWLVTDPEAHAAFLQSLPGQPQSAYLNLELPMLNQYSGVNAIPRYVTGAAH